MKPPRSHIDYLEDIRQAAEKAVFFVGGMSLAAFTADEKTVYAVIRALEVIGEAVKHIPPDIRSQHTDVPWRSMAGIRDKLIHDYLTINVEVVWKTVVDDLPSLLTRLAPIVADARKNTGP